MMTEKNPEDSVHNEQFNGEVKAGEFTEETANNEDDINLPEPQAAEEMTDGQSLEVDDPLPDQISDRQNEVSDDIDKGVETNGTVEDEPVATAEGESTPSESAPAEESVTTAEATTKESAGDESGSAEEPVVTAEGESTPSESAPVDEPVATAEGESTPSESAPVEESVTTAEATTEERAGDESGSTEEDSSEEQINYDEVELPPVDYSGFSRLELVDTLALIVENRPPAEIVDDINRIKEYFYKKSKAEFNEKRLAFAKEGGKIEEFRPEPDELEVRIKEVLKIYRHRRSDYIKIQEGEKLENLRKKQEIIEQIKDLVNREEAINKTFQEFRTLQNEWHATGIVPQSAVKDLWESYHHSVEIFYGYIKINRELRDLDLKRNLEAKIALCEKTEELLLEPSAVNAFRQLQEYHNRWREIGPVPHENKNDLWERFREATSKINRRHQDYFEKQKDERKQNLEAKVAICEKVEAIADSEILTFADFREKSDAIIEYQKLWKTIGFAPKKHNNKVYQRFRTACDKFFEKKRAYFAENKETQVRNLQLKTELCLKAEALQESSDWKETSDMLIRLQKEWKEIGPVPRKHSDKIWKRFRKACDIFFSRKSEFYSGRDTTYEDNLKLKLAIIDELESFTAGDDLKSAFEKLSDIQKRWTEAGYVPLNRKEEITRLYKDALNKQFDKLKLDDEDKNILRFRGRVESLRSNPRTARKIKSEREKFLNKIKQLEGDIVLWENNIGFFAKSANADTMIREVEEKIAEARRTIKTLEEKINLIDNSVEDY